MAMFGEKCLKLAVPPNNLVKTVESAIRIWPPRVPFGDMLMHELNPEFPAAVHVAIVCLSPTPRPPRATLPRSSATQP
jgi:hypothetical protein